MNANDKKIKSVLPLLLFVAASTVSLLIAQSPGTFTPIGNMTTPRARHTATLLLNGKVLISGGRGDGNSVLASAELYDPSTGTFSATGTMVTARTLHTATLLADGRVLIAGGRTGTGSGSQDIGSAELYDPSAGAFLSIAPMMNLRGLHWATLLADGRVLMEGCAIPCNSAIAELYDPATQRFADAGTPGAGGGAATLLVDGKVLITGGCPADPADFRSSKAQVFDPGTAMFSFTGLLTNSCADINTATLLTNGKVLFVGASEYPDPADAALYDPVAGTFTSLGHTIGLHEFSTATLLPNGTVLITGSNLPGGNGDPGVELYSPTTGTFALTGSMSAGRSGHTATLLPDGSVLVAGGYSLGATASAEIYRPGELIASPVLYSLSGDGRGQGAILHAGTAQTTGPDYPATVGEALEIYLTGLMDGSEIPPQISIGGRMAEVLWFGTTPGSVGLNQVNVRVPSGIASGPAVPVRLIYLSRPSNEVTMAVR